MIARKVPLKRSSKPIARRTKPARVRRSAAGQEKHRKDRAWSEAVKAKGPCVAIGQFFRTVEMVTIEFDDGSREKWESVSFPTHVCAGPIDPAHVMSRTFPATRHEVANGVPICRAAHDWFTVRPKAWESFCRQLLGDQEYDRLDAKAHGNISR